MSLATLQLERAANGVVRLRLNRPEKRNAQTFEMWRELREVGIGLVDDPSVRVVVVSGNGDAFSAGIDLGVLMGLAKDPSAGPPLEVCRAAGGAGSKVRPWPWPSPIAWTETVWSPAADQTSPNMSSRAGSTVQVPPPACQEQPAAAVGVAPPDQVIRYWIRSVYG
ncbi:MAG: enoyl-CoA hydratase/isomerase family protein [Gemmatimonadetes bacterium]|nr:enoyl-CoA hydratase/isomerase family protein [Gemmatimonadota bacterium]